MEIHSLIRRLFDLLGAIFGLLLLGGVLAIVLLVARIDTGQSGLFRQQRLGRGGLPFTLYKVRTMRPVKGITTTATSKNDPRITRLGHLIRRLKVDELPQLWNVLRGDMTFVGPRPEVLRYGPVYRRRAPEVLKLRPGITGPATLLYRNEEQLLAQSDNPETLNDSILFPDKMRINATYAKNRSMTGDLRIVWQTLTGRGPRYTDLTQLPSTEDLDHAQKCAA